MSNRLTFNSIWFALINLFIFSCSESYPESNDLVSVDEYVETATGVTLNFSDLGNSKLLLTTPKLVKSNDENKSLLMECPIGMKLTFYDSLKNVESILISDYGKLFAEKQILKVKENVQFFNYKNDTLFADELVIDFAKDSIYSEKSVIFSNEEGRIKGKKLKANSNFTYFEMTDISESHVNYDL